MLKSSNFSRSLYTGSSTPKFDIEGEVVKKDDDDG